MKCVHCDANSPLEEYVFESSGHDVVDGSEVEDPLAFEGCVCPQCGGWQEVFDALDHSNTDD